MEKQNDNVLSKIEEIGRHVGGVWIKVEPNPKRGGWIATMGVPGEHEHNWSTGRTLDDALSCMVGVRGGMIREAHAAKEGIKALEDEITNLKRRHGATLGA